MSVSDAAAESDNPRILVPGLRWTAGSRKMTAREAKVAAGMTKSAGCSTTERHPASAEPGSVY